jgi:SAM-dependent methyltransferase
MKNSSEKLENRLKKLSNLSKEYDEDYFENGIVSGKSCYTDYRWLPEQTIKFAHKLVRILNLREGDHVLDYGCAKGFLVKAFRILDIDAYGCDISKYAIENSDKDVKKFCRIYKGKIPFDLEFHWTISKDVFEHLDENELDMCLNQIKNVSNNLFVVVPLGENDEFVVPAYRLDKTHKLAKERVWWESKFESHNWRVDRFSYLVPGIKDNWKKYEKGNGFFLLKNNSC